MRSSSSRPPDFSLTKRSKPGRLDESPDRDRLYGDRNEPCVRTNPQRACSRNRIRRRHRSKDSWIGEDWEYPSMRDIVGGRKLMVLGLTNDQIGYITADNNYHSILTENERASHRIEARGFENSSRVQEPL